MLNSIRSRLLFNAAVVMTIMSVIGIFTLYKASNYLIYESVKIFEKNLILDVLNIFDGLNNNYNFKKNEKSENEDNFHLFYLIVLDKNKKPIYIQEEEHGPYANISTTCQVKGKADFHCFDEFAKYTDKKEGVEIISDKGHGFSEESIVYTMSIKHSENTYYIAAIWQKSVIDTAIKVLLIVLCFFSLIFFLCSFLLLSYFLTKTISPLAILSHKINRLAGHDFTDGDTEELKAGLPVAEKNEIGELAQTFSLMIDELATNVRQLVATTAINERVEKELEVARGIQLDTLPQNFSLAEEKGVELYAYLVPALEVGGDLYDFFFIDEEHLCFTVGDVAGKGIPAALFMVITKKLISSIAQLGLGKSPGEMMTRINEMLYRENPSAMFVTLFIGVLNVKTGELRYANGGHVPPIFSHCDAEPAYRKDLSGPVVGVIPGVTYRELTAVLQPGAAVFLCSDGVTEAMSEQDELFGDKRLLEEFTHSRDFSCQQAVEALLGKIRLHAGTAPQSDDIAMLMIKFFAK